MEFATSWERWVTLERVITALMEKKKFGKVNELKEYLGDSIQQRYLSELLSYLEKKDIIRFEKEGDIKRIIFNSWTNARDEILNNKFMDEFKSVSKKLQNRLPINILPKV